MLINSIVMDTVKTFQQMNIDCQNLRFKISDSSRDEKFSVHLVANYYFETWQQQCKFVQKVFSEQIEMKLIDGNIYNEGGRAMRLVGSTKFGVDSFLTPIESYQERYDKQEAS